MQRQPRNIATRPPLPPLPKGGRRSRCESPRRGFTLVEMMVVVVIIAILAGLIVPALRKAMITANEARVITEIKGLESAVAAFKAKYGVEPPSQFVLYTQQSGGAAATQAAWNANPSTMAIVRQIWPQFDFTMAAGNNNIVPYPPYWDTIATTTSTDPNKALRMNSGECMLFFLGGIISIQGQHQVPQGFNKNPAYPFSPVSQTSGNREGPFFEFTAVDRIKDLDGNQINEWYDALPNQSLPYLYFSSYDGRAYNTFELPNNGTTFSYMHDMYRVYTGPITQAAFPLPPAAPNTAPAGTSAALPAQKPQTFQIISPGYDGNYGIGGVFNPSLTNSGLIKGFDTNNNPIFDTDAYDNLTNFNGGRLKP